MSENPFAITLLNDFIFCPASIYFHKIDAETDDIMYASEKQINGKSKHEAIDSGLYSTSRNILQGISVYSSKFGFYGKIDLYDIDNEELSERKLFISKLYDGQVFQLYAQYFCLIEMGYPVKKLKIHSLKDNKNYPIPLPSEDNKLYNKFVETIERIKTFNVIDFKQNNVQKCLTCVYEPLCPFSVGE